MVKAKRFPNVMSAIAELRAVHLLLLRMGLRDVTLRTHVLSYATILHPFSTRWGEIILRISRDGVLWSDRISVVNDVLLPTRTMLSDPEGFMRAHYVYPLPSADRVDVLYKAYRKGMPCTLLDDRYVPTFSSSELYVYEVRITTDYMSPGAIRVKSTMNVAYPDRIRGLRGSEKDKLTEVSIARVPESATWAFIDTSELGNAQPLTWSLREFICILRSVCFYTVVAVNRLLKRLGIMPMYDVKDFISRSCQNRICRCFLVGRKFTLGEISEETIRGAYELVVDTPLTPMYFGGVELSEDDERSWLRDECCPVHRKGDILCYKCGVMNCNECNTVVTKWMRCLAAGQMRRLLAGCDFAQSIAAAV